MHFPISKKRKLHILLLSCGCLAAAALFCVLAKAGITIPCIFHRVTGLLCPGCGNSRAALALLRLDLSSALEYNLLFPLEFGYIAWVYLRCCRSYLRGGRFSYHPPLPAVDIFVLVVIVLWGISRNLI